MEKLTYAQIQDELNKVDQSDCQKLKITVLRNITLEPIEPYLQYLAYQSGLKGEVHFGEYDHIFQEAVVGQPDSLNEETDCVMVFMILDGLSWELSRNFASLNETQIENEIHRIQEQIEVIIQGIRRQTKAMILWHSFEIPAQPSLGIWDSQVKDGQQGQIQRLNKILQTQLQTTPHAYYVNTNLCVTRVGANNFYDFKFWHIGRSPYSREALSAIAGEDFKFIRALKGKNKKCLVLDCDNTLWGGIVGEEGLAGIKLGKTHPGSSFHEFQQEIVNFYHRGIIIALCSKNNEEDVWEVFQNHPEMVLQEHHVATSQINWKDKVTNLRQIALDLNIGLESIVFIDDSEFEVNLVRRELPEVEAILLPVKVPTNYRSILISCDLFDTLTLSDEDKNRGAMYRAEVSRKNLQAKVTDMKSYYCSLEMVIDIKFADEFSIPRIAQLTQKTNQFNLTTHRYSDAEIKQFIESEIYDVIYIKLVDKFGDSGIVGTCILHYKGTIAVIDTLLMSCRVLGRSLEDILLIQVLKLAKRQECISVIGEYHTTKKNKQVEFFLAQHKFEELDSKPFKQHRKFVLDLNKEIEDPPKFFKVINSQIE